MPVTAYYNPDDENHRNWKENFGFTDDDTINDNSIETYQGEKKLPVIVVDVPACSYTETVSEWYNPVTGAELGEQEITLNVEMHTGTYYFENLTQYNNWVTDTLNTLSSQVDSPDGVTNLLPASLLPSEPAWWNDYAEK